jgi:uncharacterized membrane protein
MQRISSIDLARGFTVLFIPAIHCIMLYSDVKVHQSILGQMLGFIAEWPGAQIFMLLMGVSFPLSKTFSPKKILVKACALLLIGYLLNYLKFVLPIELGVMPKEFLSEYANGKFSQLDFFFIGDILQFAAIALLVLLVVYKLPHSVVVTLCLIVLILFASPLVWDLHSDNVIINHILSLFFGQPPATYFPVFPWLIYPLTGFAIGIAIKEKFYNFYKDLLIVGSFVFLCEYLAQFTKFHFPTTSFYRTFPDQTLMHVGFAVAWFAMWHFISTRFPGNKFFSFITFFSKNITLVYFIQWVLIFWCFPLFGYHRLYLGMSIIVSISISAIVFFFSYLIVRLSNRKKNHHQQPLLNKSIASL